jgi:hypothetical protein
VLSDSFNSISVCAGAGSVAHNVDITGSVFANSCVPGAQPRKKDSSSATMQCGGLCQPNDVTQGMNVADEGGVGAQSCQTKWGAAPPANPTAGESCRYWWSRETFTGLSRFSNTLGFCFKHAVFLYDTNGDTTDDAPWPRCINTTTGDVLPPIANPMHNDAEFFWCVANPNKKLATPLPRQAVQLDQLTGWR